MDGAAPARGLLATLLAPECDPKRAALAFEGSGAGSALCFSALAAAVKRTEARIERLGLGPGHRLALLFPPGPALLITLLAALERGLLVTLLSASLGPAARALRLQRFAPDLVLNREDDLESAPFLRDLPALQTPARGLLLWSSGTTGAPKGVVLTPEALLWNATRNGEVLGLAPTDRALIALDPAYCYALVHQIFTHWRIGAAVLLPRQPMDPLELGATARRLGATTLAVVPSLLQAILRLPRQTQALRSLRLLTVGGAMVPEALLREAAAALPGVELLVTYGLTEAGPRVCTRRFHPEAAPDEGLVGTPLPGVAVRCDEAGELQVRSPSACLAYLESGRLVPAPPWIPTGDRATVDAEGQVRIRGRLRPLINRAGVKIAPFEIEQVLRAHPQVQEAQVRAAPHPRLGEVPFAYVVPRPGHAPSAEQLSTHCREALGAAWTPARFDLVPRLPGEPRGWKDAEP